MLGQKPRGAIAVNPASAPYESRTGKQNARAEPAKWNASPAGEHLQPKRPLAVRADNPHGHREFAALSRSLGWPRFAYSAPATRTGNAAAIRGSGGLTR